MTHGGYGCPWDGVRILDRKHHHNLAVPSSRRQGYSYSGSHGLAPPGWHQPLAPGQALHHHTGMGLCARGRPRADLLGDPGLLLVVKEPQTHRQGLSPRQAPVFFSEQKSPLRLFCQRLCQGHLVPLSRRLRMRHLGRWGPLGAAGSPGPLHPPSRWGVGGGGVTQRGVTQGL